MNISDRIAVNLGRRRLSVDDNAWNIASCFYRDEFCRQQFRKSQSSWHLRYVIHNVCK